MHGTQNSLSQATDFHVLATTHVEFPAESITQRHINFNQTIKIRAIAELNFDSNSKPMTLSDKETLP